MNVQKMSSVEMKSVCRKQSVNMSSREGNIVRNTAAQREDEESVDSSVRSSKMAQRRGNFVSVGEREAKPIRRHVFDDMHDYFCNRRVDPAVKFNSSLAPPGPGRGGEMWFGDLDFSIDAFDYEEYDPAPNGQHGEELK